MSLPGAGEPPGGPAAPPSVEAALEPRTRPLVEGFTVRRLLPQRLRRSVGPFVFFDHLGPLSMAPGRGLDVLPHPHIGLATVTYLFEGELLHRDSLGSEELIRPGAVNWMSAGRGVVHSERSPAGARSGGAALHGLQLWAALPRESEEGPAAFEHVSEGDLPEIVGSGVILRVVAGRALGESSPVRVPSPLFYLDARLEAGARLELPEDYPERAAYVVRGAVQADDRTFGEASMLVFREGGAARIRATGPSRVMLLGGAPLDGERHVWWNFVSSRRERIEEAKRAWRERSFPGVPGDPEEFMPLPEERGQVR